MHCVSRGPVHEHGVPRGLGAGHAAVSLGNSQGRGTSTEQLEPAQSVGSDRKLYELPVSRQGRLEGQMTVVCMGAGGLCPSHLAPPPSRHLLAPWTPSALPLAALSPPSWGHTPSRFHCPSAKRSATAWTPPTHGAMTGVSWRRSSPWTGGCWARSPQRSLPLSPRRRWARLQSLPSMVDQELSSGVLKP